MNRTQMGAGRKKRTVIANDKSLPQSQRTVNSGGLTARNLRKTDLAGVIFGCRHCTIRECFSKKLFGLPVQHYSYVQNINPGLPLFLFNYSDRRLHGIFEAACDGRLNIDPCAWTDGSEPTPYGAQVKTRIRMQCQSLNEEQFRSIIDRNYYHKKHFWFELDQDQTDKLISLFSSSPFIRSRVQSNAVSRSADDHSVGEAGQGLEARNSTDAEENHNQEVSVQRVNFQQSCSSVVTGIDASCPPNTWSSLFKNETDSNARRENEHPPKTSASVRVSHDFDESNSEADFSGHLNEIGKFPELTIDKEDYRDYYEAFPTSDMRLAAKDFRTSEIMDNSEWSSSCVSPSLDGEGQLLDRHIEVGALKVNEGEDVYLKTSSECSDFNMQKLAISGENHGELARIHPMEEMVSENNSSIIHSVVVQLLLQVEDLKSSQLVQIQKINSLESELVASRLEIQQLKDRCKNLESGSFPVVGHLGEEVAEAEEVKSTNEFCAKFDESLLMAGGFDGFAWISSLDSYSPSRDILKSLRPMSSVRSLASAAKLNGELYVFGGGDGNCWYDTVESYNPLTNQWMSRPSLTQRKGSLAGVALDEKIFAIGGGNGVECFSEVEMFEPDAGMWIPCRSMFHKRFATAAAEMNGMLYVAGGYDGMHYLKSVEGFDPREHSWRKLGSMTMKRGCHSLVVLNEKLYAMGGYDGDGMVRTMEIFEPRVGSWMIGEPMHHPRGYFGAVVLGGSLYAVGGLQDENILESVESYKEGHGWQLLDCKAIGRRCFFSAAVV